MEPVSIAQLLEPDCYYYQYAVFSFFGFLYVYSYISPAVSAHCYKQFSGLSAAVKVDWNSRVMATIMALLIMCFYSFIMLWEDRVYVDGLWIGSPAFKAAMALLSGYTFADLLVMIWNISLLGVSVYIFHHMAALVLICHGMTYNLPLDVVHFGLLMEFSTPFVHSHWFFKTIKYPVDNIIFNLNGILLAVTFFIARVASIPFLWYNIYRVHGNAFVSSAGWYVSLVGCAAINLLNLFWFSKIIITMLKVLRKTSKRNKTMKAS